MKFFILILFLLSSKFAYGLEIKEVKYPFKDRINLNKDLRTPQDGCLMNQDYELDNIYDSKIDEFEVCFGMSNKKGNKKNTLVNLEFATYIHTKKKEKESVFIPIEHKNQNRFNKIYSFKDSMLKLKKKAYLNSAVYDILAIEEENKPGNFHENKEYKVIKYKKIEEEDKKHIGIFVVTSAPMVGKGKDDLSEKKEGSVHHFASLDENQEIKSFLYFLNPEADRCKTIEPYVSYSRDDIDNKEETAGDFYRACKEKNIVNGVMLTNFIETPKSNGEIECKVKADIYFPLKEGDSLIFDEGKDTQVKVTTAKLIKHNEDFNKLGADIRKLEIYYGKDSQDVGHTMTHYHFRLGRIRHPDRGGKSFLKKLSRINC